MRRVRTALLPAMGEVELFEGLGVCLRSSQSKGGGRPTSFFLKIFCIGSAKIRSRAPCSNSAIASACWSPLESWCSSQMTTGWRRASARQSSDSASAARNLHGELRWPSSCCRTQRQYPPAARGRRGKRRDLRDDAVDRADVDAAPHALVRSANTEQAAWVWVRIRGRREPRRGRRRARIPRPGASCRSRRALRPRPAAIRTQRGADALVAHGDRSCDVGEGRPPSHGVAERQEQVLQRRPEPRRTFALELAAAAIVLNQSCACSRIFFFLPASCEAGTTPWPPR